MKTFNFSVCLEFNHLKSQDIIHDFYKINQCCLITSMLLFRTRYVELKGLVDRKCICNMVIAKMSWFQLLKYEDFLHFFVSYDRNFNFFGFRIIIWTKQAF